MAKGSFAVIIPIRVGSVHGLTTHIPTLVVQEGLLNLEVVSETVPRIPAQRTMRREARVSTDGCLQATTRGVTETGPLESLETEILCKRI